MGKEKSVLLTVPQIEMRGKKSSFCPELISTSEIFFDKRRILLIRKEEYKEIGAHEWNSQPISQRNRTSARFAALSSSEEFEFLSLSPTRDLGVCGESESSCW